MPGSNPVPRPRYVLPETRALASLGCADLLATVYLVATNRAHEANPLAVSALNAYGPVGLVLFKVILLAIPLTVAELYRPYKPALVTLGLRVVLLVYLFMLAMAYGPVLRAIFATRG